VKTENTYVAKSDVALDDVEFLLVVGLINASDRCWWSLTNDQTVIRGTISLTTQKLAIETFIGQITEEQWAKHEAGVTSVVVAAVEALLKARAEREPDLKSEDSNAKLEAERLAMIEAHQAEADNPDWNSKTGWERWVSDAADDWPYLPLYHRCLIVSMGKIRNTLDCAA
jgi:hypothetical protein